MHDCLQMDYLDVIHMPVNLPYPAPAGQAGSNYTEFISGRFDSVRVRAHLNA
jgi:hypothetical protein